jgi:hypothetical protein
VVFLFALSAFGYSCAGGSIDAAAWADMALRAAIPIFVLGVSVVSLTRSLSETGRFTGEYLNEACRMSLFCCLAFLAAVMAVMGWLMGTISFFHPLVSVCVAAGSVGAVIACLGMLAFVVLETIRCLVPNESIRVVSGFAAAKLCHGYLKEVYVRLSESQHNACLEKWCVEHCRAIHPASQYYAHYLGSDLGSDKGMDSCVIPLKKTPSDANAYKDFHLGRLEELDSYLREHSAELYLSSPQYGSERTVFGILSCPGVVKNGDLRGAVERMGNRAVRFRSLAFTEETDDFWESQQSALAEAIQRAVGRADAVQVRAYLDAVNKPLTVLRKARRHPVVRDAYGEYVRRGYDFLALYLRALQEILASEESGPKHRSAQAFALARTLLKSIWEETQKIVNDLDYHTMELFTWLVQQMYAAIKVWGDKAGPLLGMRAQFGGFYTFADGWLKHNRSTDTEAVDRMRHVLHEGLTKWLLIVLERPEESELVKQLCDAGRGIVFGRDKITFERGALVARHFVLAGHLMHRQEAADVKAAAAERLFCEEYSHSPDVNFKDLVAFYLSNPFPPEAIASYLHAFYKPQQQSTSLLDGSSYSSGFGMTGVHEMALAFTYLAASALADGMQTPDPIAKDLSHEITDNAMKTVAQLFKNTGVDYGLKPLKDWVEKSKKLNDEAEAEAIAEAQFDPEKVEEWRKKFWEAYSRSSPVLSMCLRNGNYQIDESASSQLPDRLLKIAVIDWKYPLAGGGGDDHARRVAGYMEGRLISKMATAADKPSRVEGSLSDSMSKAVAWLRKRGCDGEKGMVIVMTKHAPASQLYRDDSYVPSWREDVRSRGFDGFYQGFPVVWYSENGEEEDVKEEMREPRPESLVAVDLRGWKGIKVRVNVITEQKLGELTIRTWTEGEIQKALDSKELEMKDVNKAKGNCPVDISLYWELSSSDPPRTKVFETQTGS